MTGAEFDPAEAARQAERLIGAEIAAWGADRLAREAEETSGRPGRPESWYRVTLEDFRAHRQAPEEVEVNFSGGMTGICIAVTRPNGPYQVVYMPAAGYFSLCVRSQFGPLDIGIHGDAIACFGSI